MIRRDAKKAARTVETISKAVEKIGPRVGVVPPDPSASLEPDGPACTKGQRVWVGQVCKVAVAQGILAGVPEFDDLTIGQAEGILRQLGSPVGELYKLGRDIGQRKDQDRWKATQV